MDMESIKNKIRIFIFGVFGIIITFIIIRGFLILIGANENAPFMKFWNDGLTHPFVYPFQGIYSDWLMGSIRIETASLLAIFVYLIISLILAKLVASFFGLDAREMLVDLVDTLFKVVEFILIFRFLFKLTDASTLAPFSHWIVDILSTVVYEPFVGILPTVTFGDNNEFIFETSTVIAIIIIIILDILTESIFRAMFDKSDDERKDKSQYNPAPFTNITNVNQPLPQLNQQTYPTNQQTIPSINIHVAPQPIQTQPREYISVDPLQPAQQVTIKQYPPNQLPPYPNNA